MSNVFEAFLSTPEMLGVFAERPIVQAMLDAEAALAHALADEGLIAPAAAEAVAAACRVDRYDVPALVAASASAGSLAIPLVAALTAEVARHDAAAASAVHLGATSQDIVDTAMVLATRRALSLIDRDLGVLAAALIELAERHRATPMLGRTLMQPAAVISVGHKITGWAAAVVRGQARWHAAGGRALQLQLGGAVGTLASLGAHGPAVARRMAEHLRLPLPAGVWHTQRDEWVALATALGVLVGTLGKIARDLSLLAQAEVGEMHEPAAAGRGGSSAMPHKQNPVACLAALAAAQRVPAHVAALLTTMAQEHERGLGGWQAELAEWAGLFIATHGALRALAQAAPGLQVHSERMRANIDRLHGLASSEAVATRLAAVLGREAAQARVTALTRQVVAEGRPLQALLREAVAVDAALRAAIDDDEIDTLCDPQHAADLAAERADQTLAAIRPLAAALAAAAPWQAALPEEEGHDGP